jgi:hypothetical protein
MAAPVHVTGPRKPNSIERIVARGTGSVAGVFAALTVK